MADKTNMLIHDVIVDKKIRKYLYLDSTIDELVDTLNNLKLDNFGDDSIVPFTAKIRGYTGATDQNGAPWLLKDIPDEEAPMHKYQEIAFYIDFLMKTPAAPTILIKHNDKFYRATKHVQNAMQIGSYNYLDPPFMKMLGNDLINRWLFFDEDRNPNNYMVIHDDDSKPYIVVIDYNKADLESEEMKIHGMKDKFGWHREEKTRFLTLLKPENFEMFTIEDFDQRLKIMMGIKESVLIGICNKVFTNEIFEDPKAAAKLIVDNFLRRRAYLDKYFRTWFKERDLEKEKEVDARYAGLGKSFTDYYKR
ncbi:MAG: hypothetical protein KAQ93_02695 [Spirochaetales bacterium]|nr:hypothetical protein [Spirochaetales bacterium]